MRELSLGNAPQISEIDRWLEWAQRSFDEIERGSREDRNPDALKAGLGLLDDLFSLTDPNADRILFFDDSEGAAGFLTVGTGLAITTTTLAVNLATTAQYLANTSGLVLSTDQVAASGALFPLTDGASIAWDMALGFNASVTLGGNRTLANPTNTIAGRTGAIVVTQDGTGSRTLAYGTSWEAAGGVFPVLYTAVGAKDIISYWVQSSTSIIITGILKAVA